MSHRPKKEKRKRGSLSEKYMEYMACRSRAAKTNWANNRKTDRGAGKATRGDGAWCVRVI